MRVPKQAPGNWRARSRRSHSEFHAAAAAAGAQKSTLFLPPPPTSPALPSAFGPPESEGQPGSLSGHYFTWTFGM